MDERLERKRRRYSWPFYFHSLNRMANITCSENHHIFCWTLFETCHLFLKDIFNIMLISVFTLLILSSLWHFTFISGRPLYIWWLVLSLSFYICTMKIKEKEDSIYFLKNAVQETEVKLVSSVCNSLPLLCDCYYDIYIF